MITKIENLSEAALIYTVNKTLGLARSTRGVQSIAEDEDLYYETITKSIAKYNIHFIQYFSNGGGVAFTYEPSVSGLASYFSFKNPHKGFNLHEAVARTALAIRLGSDEVDLPDCFNSHGELLIAESFTPPDFSIRGIVKNNVELEFAKQPESMPCAVLPTPTEAP